MKKTKKDPRPQVTLLVCAARHRAAKAAAIRMGKRAEAASLAERAKAFAKRAGR